jgi:hypothetical protein
MNEKLTDEKLIALLEESIRQAKEEKRERINREWEAENERYNRHLRRTGHSMYRCNCTDAEADE